MNFQTFKDLLEEHFSVEFEMLEYHYSPYAFGSGYVAYHIKGYNYMIIYDGRDKVTTVKRSNKHENYKDANWTVISFEQQGLDVETALRAMEV